MKDQYRLRSIMEDESIPCGYLITFRTYGTWLHGDARGSVDRFHNRFGTPLLAPSERRRNHNIGLMKQAAVRLGARARARVKKAICDACKMKEWGFWTTNVRTNHVHTVVSAPCRPDRILADFKANATRELREAGLWRSERSPWVARGSTRYLWTEADVINAVMYVECEQGESLP